MLVSFSSCRVNNDTVFASNSNTVNTPSIEEEKDSMMPVILDSIDKPIICNDKMLLGEVIEGKKTSIIAFDISDIYNITPYKFMYDFDDLQAEVKFKKRRTSHFAPEDEVLLFSTFKKKITSPNHLRAKIVADLFIYRSAFDPEGVYRAQVYYKTYDRFGYLINADFTVIDFDHCTKVENDDL